MQFQTKDTLTSRDCLRMILGVRNFYCCGDAGAGIVQELVHRN